MSRTHGLPPTLITLDSRSIALVPRPAPPLAVPPAIDQLLSAHAPVCIGVSGGKDSAALALALSTYLDRRGHQGPRLLVHADLGRIEWADSLPSCRRLAAHLGLELLIVRRAAGGYLERVCTRWRHSRERYADLACVRLIPPWPTAAMRFCTSELKTDPISAALVRRFPGHTIVSALGVRRQESRTRTALAVTAPEAKLARKRAGTTGLVWRPLLDWRVEDVFAEIAQSGLCLHEAYRVYGTSRVSCAFCFLGSQPDLAAAARCPANRDPYVALCELEIASTFAYQERHWLCDLAPHLLPADLRRQVSRGKERAAIRRAMERLLPPHLLYTKGWPVDVPTLEEAKLLDRVRTRVGEAVGIPLRHEGAAAIQARYAELLAKRRRTLG